MNRLGEGPGAAILGVGAYRPSRVVTNDDLSSMVDTNDEWIRTRTGISTRRLAAEAETIPVMAVAAAGKALAHAGIAPEQVGLVLAATCSYRVPMPGASAVIAQSLGAVNAGAFDINAACAGFSYAMSMAADTVRTGSSPYILVIGVERISDLTDWTDRSTCILFGDGAGAVVVGPTEHNGIGPAVWGNDAERASAITTTDAGFIHMEGQAVFRWATTALAPVARAACERAGIEPSELRALIPHQANIRIVDSLARALHLPETTVIARDMVDAGNTSAASIPLALARLIETGAVRSGDPALLLGFGAGLTYAGQVVTCP